MRLGMRATQALQTRVLSISIVACVYTWAIRALLWCGVVGAVLGYLKAALPSSTVTHWRLQGNVIDDVKPTYAVQDGTWGPPKEAMKENLDDVFGKKPVSVRAPLGTAPRPPSRSSASRPTPALPPCIYAAAAAPQVACAWGLRHVARFACHGATCLFLWTRDCFRALP